MSLLVIEGLDGSGKSTQVQKLKNYFEDTRIAYRYMHFPRTEGNAFAGVIARFLRGDLGKLEQVNPYLIAMMYAGDRFDAKLQIESWLRHDRLILLDRYVYSNIAYQCAKVSDPKEKEQLKHWIMDTEFGYFGMPRPDLNLFLDVPSAFTQKSLSQERTGKDRWYLLKKKDIHEENTSFQEEVRGVYRSLASEPDFAMVDCSTDNHTMASPEIIFEKIISALKDNGIV